jgi:hypothetical protein
MKKLVLFLFFLPLIYSCDHILNNRTFLEKYTGVIWHDTTHNPSDPENSYYIVFTNDGYTSYETFGNMSVCDIDEIIWGQPDSNGMVVNITEDSIDLLVLQTSNADILKFTAVDNGNILVVSSNPNEDGDTFIKVSSHPCN